MDLSTPVKVKCESDHVMVALSQVKSIFVNIFGGIARCDHIAEAVVAGVKAVGGNAAIKPLVIRLEGRWDGMGWDDVQHMMGSWGLVGICATKPQQLWDELG